MTSRSATIVSTFVLSVALSGCAGLPFGDTETTQDHSNPEAAVEVATAEEPVLIRGSLEEPESKLAAIDERQLAAVPRPKPQREERELTARLKPRVVAAAKPLQCVPFVRDATGIMLRGNANTWWDLAADIYQRSSRPEKGAILVMRGYKSDRRGHVAVVKEILDDRTIVIDHANWLNDGKIYLNAPVRDESPANDWSQVRVWYTPGEQWGHRVYVAKGFIYPTTTLPAVAMNTDLPGTALNMGSFEAGSFVLASR